VLKAGVAPERIGIGGGFPAITDSIALTRTVLGLGLRHVLYLPPYFDRGVTPEGIEDAFAAIIDGVADDRLRASLYHIPQVSGVAIPTGVAANLRKRYGEVVAGRIARQAAGYRPRGQHAVALQAQVPVQAPGAVFLDDEARPALPAAPFFRRRLGRRAKVTLALVLAELAAIFLACLRRHQNPVLV